jgi:hypothetical protein
LRATLTFGDLRRMASLCKPLPRIIVGMPMVKDDEAWRRESDGSLFIGRTAWMVLEKNMPRAPLPGPIDTVLGIRVEFFGDCPDHWTIFREMLELLAWGGLLRISLDEEFGDTNPRIDAE